MVGDPRLAREYLADSIALYHTMRMKGDLVACVEWLAGVAALSNTTERAARLLGAAEVWRERLHQPVQFAERKLHGRLVAGTRDALDAVTAARLWEEGRAMTLEDPVTLGLEPLPEPPITTVRSSFGLTARELDVLRLASQGLTDAEVADRLFMARRTVNTHLTSIYTKLNVSSRAAATRFAVEHDLT